MNFGDKLRAIREDKNMTQDELAALLGTSKQVISRYETGQRVPKITVAIEYAQKLNIPAIYFTDNTISSIDEATASVGKSNFYCSKQEQFLLEKYRRLPDTGKQAVESMIDTMLAAQPEPQDRLVPVKVSGVMDIPGDYVAPESAVKKAQERMTPVVAAAFGDDGAEPQLRMVSEEAVARAAAEAERLATESAEADREREEAAARIRAAYAQKNKKKRRK